MHPLLMQELACQQGGAGLPAWLNWTASLAEMGSDGAGLPGGELLAGLLRAAGSSLVGMEVAAAAGNGFGLGLLTQQVQIPLATAWRLMTARVAAGAGAGGWSYYLNLDPAVGQPGVVNAPLSALQGRHCRLLSFQSKSHPGRPP